LDCLADSNCCIKCKDFFPCIKQGSTVSCDRHTPKTLLAKVKAAQSLSECIDVAFDLYADRKMFGTRTSRTNSDGSTIYNWLSYSEADRASKLFSDGLARLLPAGSSVAICSLTASTDTYLAAISVARTSMISIGVSPTMTDEQIIYVLQRSCAGAVVCQPALVSRFEGLAPRCPNLRVIIPNNTAAQVLPGMQCASPLVLTAWRTISVDDVTTGQYRTSGIEAGPIPKNGKGIFSIIFTSGSTGNPKGVFISLDRWKSEAFVPAPRNTGSVIVCAFTQPAWFMSQWTVWRCFFNGGRSGFSSASDHLMNDIRGIGPTVVFAPPAVWAPIARSFRAEVEVANVFPDALRAEEMEKIKTRYRAMVGARAHSVSVGSAKVPDSLLCFLRGVFGCSSQVYDGYGTTEFGHLLKNGKICQEGVEVKLVDVPQLGYSSSDMPHPRGELLVRSANMIPEYVGEADETKAAWDEDGWYHTGDIVEEVGKEHFVFVDRLKSFFKLADGTFASAANIEGLLLGCPAVHQIYVNAVPQLAATVVPTPELVEGVRHGRLTELVLRQRLLEEFTRCSMEQNLAENLIPRFVAIELEPWTPENGLLSLSMKPVRPALALKYDGAMADMMEGGIEGKAHIVDSKLSVGQWFVGELINSLRQDLMQICSTTAAKLFACHKLHISPRLYKSQSVHIRITLHDKDVIVDARSSLHDPWGEMATLSVGSGSDTLEYRSLSLDELTDSRAGVLLSVEQVPAFQQLLMQSGEHIQLVDHLRRGSDSILATLRVAGPSKASLLVDSAILLSHGLGTEQLSNVTYIGQVVMFDILDEEEGVYYLHAFKTGMSASFVIYAVDASLIFRCGNLFFEGDTKANNRLIKARDHCYEFLWENSPSFNDLSLVRRNLTLVTGRGPRAKAVADAMQVLLGSQSCSISNMLPATIATDVMLLSFLDDVEVLDGLTQCLAYVQTIAL